MNNDSIDWTPIVTNLVRGLLTLAGGAGFTWALTVNASQIQMIVSALMILGAQAWGIYQKISASKQLKLATQSMPNTVSPNLPL